MSDAGTGALRPAAPRRGPVEAKSPAGAAPAQAKGRDLVALAGSVGQLAANTGRQDLVQRLENTQARLRDPNVRVVVVGEFKQGKSKLINALVNAPVCPIDDDVATSVPTAVGYGEEPAAYVLMRPAGEDGDASTDRTHSRSRSTSSRSTSPNWATRATNATWWPPR